MAKKDVVKYYEQVEAQYLEMARDFNEISELCERQIVSPEQVDQYSKTIEPLKRNYMMLSYIMFLLNQRKNGKKTRKDVNLLSHSISDKEVLEENNQVLNKIKEIKSNDN